ncbi:MAG: hypothetical protein G01um101466_88, partial [Parcubacteria group bacterium Gr01-1014_66]
RKTDDKVRKRYPVVLREYEEKLGEKNRQLALAAQNYRDIVRRSTEYQQEIIRLRSLVPGNAYTFPAPSLQNSKPLTIQETRLDEDGALLVVIKDAHGNILQNRHPQPKDIQKLQPVNGYRI